nr:helix-turn-helix domain-containing protein [Pseudarthrobacter psychrotolerans]
MPKSKAGFAGKQPKLSKSQEARLVSLYKGGQHTTAEIAELFKVARSTVPHCPTDSARVTNT